MHTPPEKESTEGRIREVLERELAQITTHDAAVEVVRRLEGLSAGQTEAERGAKEAGAGPSAATRVERASEGASGEAEIAAVLAETAAQAVTPTDEAAPVLDAAQQVLTESPGTLVPPTPGAAAPPPPSPDAQRGRTLLKEAALERMDPLQSLDARLFLAVNSLPHPRWLDRAANVLTLVTTGGWVWALGLLAAHLLGVRRAWPTLKVLLPSLAATTWIVEHPVKSYFRRRRPFIDIVRALVVGARPGSWSFPSGHTASSFASAWILATRWPRRSPLFFWIAATVGLSRVYVGAHYPGDVTSGALFGLALAEFFRRVVTRAIALR